MAILKNTTINDDGFLTLPSGNTAQRPGTAATGSLRFNTDTNGIEYYNGSAWIDTGAAPGTSPTNPFSSMSDIDGINATGLVPLWTDCGGTLTGDDVMLVLLDYDTPGGPWMMFSFTFGRGGWYDYDNTKWVYGQADTNHPYLNNGRSNDTANIGLGDGTQTITEHYGPDVGDLSNINYNGGRGAVTSTNGFGYGLNGPFKIEYYNQATGSLISDTQKSALQDWVRELNDSIPHLAIEEDSQGLTGSDNWQGTPPSSDSGHQLWLRDKDGLYMRATPKDNTSDENYAWFLWTENYYAEGAGGGGSLANYNNGITGLRNTKFIIPESLYYVSGTGGGLIFGTPYVRNFRQNQGNLFNDRTYFLIRGA